MPTADQTKFNLHRNLYLPVPYGTDERHVASVSGTWATLWAPDDDELAYVSCITISGQNSSGANASYHCQITDNVYNLRYRLYFYVHLTGQTSFETLYFNPALTLIPRDLSGEASDRLAINSSRAGASLWAFCTGWKIKV